MDRDPYASSGIETGRALEAVGAELLADPVVTRGRTETFAAAPDGIQLTLFTVLDE
jgi:hypothetical protein